jgi:hypothetical protein
MHTLTARRVQQRHVLLYSSVVCSGELLCMLNASINMPSAVMAHTILAHYSYENITDGTSEQLLQTSSYQAIAVQEQSNGII